MIDEIIRLINKKIRIYGSCIVAIDGRCGSGKTTLAKKLGEYFECNVFHADDFYLTGEKRKADRLGNVDCERLTNEVINPLKERKSFYYRPYSCSKGELLAPVFAEHKPLAIIEGSYSCQPCLFDFYDLHIFVDVGATVQQIRLEDREGTEKLIAFNDKWIPMEERYFNSTQLKYKCEIYYKTSV